MPDTVSADTVKVIRKSRLIIGSNLELNFQMSCEPLEEKKPGKRYAFLNKKTRKLVFARFFDAYSAEDALNDFISYLIERGGDFSKDDFFAIEVDILIELMLEKVQKHKCPACDFIDPDLGSKCPVCSLKINRDSKSSWIDDLFQ